MARIERRNKPLTVNPLKASQPLGGSLATLGFRGAIPLLHGSQGCTAFAKVYFVRHFNEPIPLQTTAIEATRAIMGSDDNLDEALATLCKSDPPRLITVLTTGLTEAAGTDMEQRIRDFRRNHPEIVATTTIVPVSTPDFVGSLESGYAETVRSILDVTLSTSAAMRTRPGRATKRVNLLLGAALSPGDVESLVEWVRAFGLEPVAIPDLGDTLDGHLDDGDFSPITTAGTTVEAVEECGDACATLVVGAAMNRAADLLATRTRVPDYRFDHLMGMAASDRLMMALREISAHAVPRSLQRQRRQLQDALLDTHSVLGTARAAVAAEADLLAGTLALLDEIGAEVVAAVAPDERAPGLEQIPLTKIEIGDLEDLEQSARERGAEWLIGNGHAAATAQRLGVPIVYCGYPIWERLGHHTRTRIGYRGARDTLFEWANALLEAGAHHGGVAPYPSIYKRAADAA